MPDDDSGSARKTTSRSGRARSSAGNGSGDDDATSSNGDETASEVSSQRDADVSSSLADAARQVYLRLIRELRVVGGVRLDDGVVKRWCLPDVSCPARLTLTAEGQQAREDNRKVCNPVIVE